MAVEVNIVYEGDLYCRATHEPSGKSMRTDAPVDNGGKGDEFSPTDLVGVALGTCQVTIMGKVAQQHGLAIEGTTVRVLKEMAADPLRRIGSLKVVITLPEGVRLSEKERVLLERGAATCPVKQSLHEAVDVQVQFVYPD